MIKFKGHIWGDSSDLFTGQPYLRHLESLCKCGTISTHGLRYLYYDELVPIEEMYADQFADMTLIEFMVKLGFGEYI